MRIIDCGLMAYDEALTLQDTLGAALGAGKGEEVLLLMEHPSVYTIGRGGQPANILDPTIKVERIHRGGDITWHGPGQLVGYPLVNLGRRGRDLHRWMWFLEEVLLDTLQAFAINGSRRPGAPGVWTERGKIAFLGVGVRRWITMHGFSLNVCPDLAPFTRINPCGYAGCPISSMAIEAGGEPSIMQVKRQLCNGFTHLLQCHLPEIDKGPGHDDYAGVHETGVLIRRLQVGTAGGVVDKHESRLL